METMIIGYLSQLVRTYEHLADTLESESKLSTSITEQALKKILRYRRKHLVDVRALVKTATELAKKAENIPRLAPSGTLLAPVPRPDNPVWTGGPPPQPLHTEFPLFAKLLPEVQDLVWEAATLPPACAHYFAIVRRASWGLPLPTASLMPDRSLWTVCHASRDSMKRVYSKAKASVKARDYCAPDNTFEQHYRRLADFVEQARQFQMDILLCNMHSTEYMPHLQLSQCSCLIRHLYRVRELSGGGWALGVCRVPFLSLFQPDWEILPKKPVCEYRLEMIDEGLYDVTREDARERSRKEPETCDGVYL